MLDTEAGAPSADMSAVMRAGRDAEAQRERWWLRRVLLRGVQLAVCDKLFRPVRDKEGAAPVGRNHPGACNK